MRAPVVATAVTTVTVAPPSVGGTMFGISNAHLVQSLSGPAMAAAGSAAGSVGLPPLKLDSPTGTGGSVRTKVNRASSICGPGPGMMLVSSLKSSGARNSTGSPVKRNSSSSSSFAGSGDRRSVFYTDAGPEQRHNKTTEVSWQPMANGAESGLTSEVNTTRASATATGVDGAKPSTLADHPGAMMEPRRKSSPEELLQRLGDGQVRSKQQRPCTAAAGGLENAVIGRKAHLKLVSQELEWERKFRDDQLSRILKALICFENRLKSEQTRIRQQLYEKDDVINRQNCTINRMKRKLAADETGGPGEEDEDDDEVTQLCPKCRKNYYRLDYRTSGTQTFEYCRDDGAESVNTENLSLNSVEYASSSEEQESSLYVRANSFKDARRSRKYTSKRSYQGYPTRGASRACSFKSNASGPASAGGTLTRLTERNERVGSPVRFDELRKREREDDEGQTETECDHEAYVNIEPSGQAVPKIVIYENYESDKENKRLDQNRRVSECDTNNYDNVEPYSNRIDNLHGIQQRNGGVLESRYGHGFRKSHGGDDGRADTCSEQAMELDDGTIFYEANTSGVGNQQKYTEGMEMKQTIETNDDWYASASDMEDSDTALGKPYSNAAVNPVLECVNQILLQQSMDGFGDSNGKDKDTPGGEPATNDEELYIGAQDPASTKNQQPAAAKEPPTQTTVRSKRVHFSTQNSMVQVPRISLQSSRTSPSSKEDKMSPTYEIQSIYSNEYEPIGSEQNSYSNYYVDMESKLGSEDRERELSLAEKRKTPPALPPKPANLLKLQQLSKTNQQRQVSLTPKASSPTVAHSDIAESEPDYCSISEIQESVKCVQIVAEIHKDACEDDYSIVDEEETGDSSGGKALELLEESFADVPKLPNVAEIVPPVKKIADSLNKFISQDNYITKSVSGSSAGGSPTKVTSGSGGGTGSSVPSILTTPIKKDGEFREQLSEIIAEINKQSPAIRNASKKQVPVKELSPAGSTSVSFRGVATQIPGVTFQSKLKPVDKLSFLSKASSGGGMRSSLTHTPKLNIGRPAAIKPPMLKSSLSQKALSSTNLTLSTGNVLSPFGSPSKSSVSYIPNLKPSSLANGSPVKIATPLKKTTGTSSTGGPGMTTATAPPPVIIAEDSKLPIQAEFDWYNLDAEYGKSTNQPDVIVEADTTSNPEQESPCGSETTDGKRANSTPGEAGEKCPTKMEELHAVAENGSEHQEEMENALEYNLDEEYKSVTPIVPPPDIIQKAPVTPPKNGKIPYNSLSFKELMQLNETPKIGAEKAKAKSAPGATAVAGTAESGPGTGNYEHFLDDSGLCSKPIILPRKKRVYYSGPFV
ncbi:uncharacterized protein LOC131207799 [Anopheles bellator]|uniref:uncharacterized protein LOC131207799 n=1 Tax=Anopheles bellator TaxID=139047 RepID=UPI002648172D|nr:uncharacterized protein LOC131207799 [Anopheles bellator]